MPQVFQDVSQREVGAIVKARLRTRALTGEWADGRRRPDSGVRTAGCCVALKRDGPSSHEKTWRGLEGTPLGEDATCRVILTTRRSGDHGETRGGGRGGGRSRRGAQGVQGGDAMLPGFIGGGGQRSSHVRPDPENARRAPRQTADVA